MGELNGSGYSDIGALLGRKPHAAAVLRGSAAHAGIRGSVRFYGTRYGTFVVAEVAGLPRGGRCAEPIFAFHIHEGARCEASGEDPFGAAGGHYDPAGCAHPYHKGDLPPLFGADGYAFSAVLTNRITVREIVGKTVIIHAGLDDFTTQPAGNAGARIACGEIERIK